MIDIAKWKEIVQRKKLDEKKEFRWNVKEKIYAQKIGKIVIPLIAIS